LLQDFSTPGAIFAAVKKNNNRMFGLPLNGTEMVVLSACQTQFGQLSEGEGLLSLAWAFRSAGVPSLIASLWNVADVRSGILQRHFYTNLLSGLPKDVALTLAKLQYIADADGEEAHPFYWAGIQLQGDVIPVSWPERALLYWIGGILLCLVIALWIKEKRF